MIGGQIPEGHHAPPVRSPAGDGAPAAVIFVAGSRLWPLDPEEEAR